LLLKAGASCNIKTKSGKTAFSLYFENRFSNLIDMLGNKFDLNEAPFLFFSFGKKIFKTNV